MNRFDERAIRYINNKNFNINYHTLHLTRLAQLAIFEISFFFFNYYYFNYCFSRLHLKIRLLKNLLMILCDL